MVPVKLANHIPSAMHFRLKARQLALVLFTIFIVQGCRENELKPHLSELEKLPAATHEGKHTMGFLLNGRAWIPRSSIRFGAVTQSIVSIGGGGEVDGLQVGFGMNINIYPPLRIGKPYNLAQNDTASSSMSIDDGVKRTLFCVFEEDAVLEGELIITHYDYQKRIMAGTFWATFLTESCDTARVTDGRFDLLFTY